jgi:ATP-binding protein involved in chromosome partitioning
MNQISEQAVLEKLENIIDPDLKKDIVTLGFVKDLQINGGDV